MSRPVDRQRLVVNAESKLHAAHDGEPWSQDELDLLMTWDGTEAELRVAAEILSRTIEACRQRFYETRSGRCQGASSKTTTTTRTMTVTTTTHTAYRGWTEDMGDE